MEIVINGKKEKIEDDMSILRLLEAKKIRPEVVTVELNGKIIEREKYQATLIKADDKLEFVYYMGGGWFDSLCSLAIFNPNYPG